MVSHPLLTSAAKAAVQQAVVAIEGRTAAEIVVTVRRSSGRYKEADYLAGFGASLLVLAGLLYLPPVFPLWTFVPNVVIGFVLGALVSAGVPAVRVWLTPRQVLIENARRAALTGFVEGGYSGLAGRHAVLVYVALAERHVEVVADVGLRHVTSGRRWTEVCDALGATLHRPDVPRFTNALQRLGDLLATAYPRAADDRNELPDEVQA